MKSIQVSASACGSPAGSAFGDSHRSPGPRGVRHDAHSVPPPCTFQTPRGYDTPFLAAGVPGNFPRLGLEGRSPMWELVEADRSRPASGSVRLPTSR